MGSAPFSTPSLQFVLEGAPFPHVTNNQCSPSCGNWGWVPVHRIEGCLFSCSICKRTQTVPSLCLQWSGISVSGAALRRLPGTPHVYQMHALSHVHSTRQSPALPWRLANLCPVTKTGNAEHPSPTQPCRELRSYGTSELNPNHMSLSED